MGEHTRLATKAPEVKQANTVSQTRKPERSQSMDSPVDRILFLQRTIGNQVVQRMVKSGVLQARLRIGQPGDMYEQEADRVADQVMRMPEPHVQRQPEEEKEEEFAQTKPLAEQITPLVQRQTEPEKEEEEEEKLAQPRLETNTGYPVQCQAEEEEEEEEPTQAKLLSGEHPKIQRQEEEEKPEEEPIQPRLNVQRQLEEKEEESVQSKQAHSSTPTVTPTLESQIQTLRGGGQPLSEPERSYFEPRFGQDFSQVRVHRDAGAAKLARAVNARAFTRGQDVIFGAGQYAPETTVGKRLLAHELTHVVQQSVNSVRQEPHPPHASGRELSNIVSRHSELIVQTQRRSRRRRGKTKKIQAVIHLRDQNRKLLLEIPIVVNKQSRKVLRELPSGAYDIKITGTESPYILSFNTGQEAKKLIIYSGKKKVKEAIGQTQFATLFVNNPGAGGSATQGIPKDKPTSPGQQVPPANVSQPPQKGGKKGGTGTGTKPGSKFGWLGWIDFLPQSVIDVLDDIFEQMEGSQEYLALRDLLQNLKHFKNFKEFANWFKSPEKLLGIVLGIEGDQNVINQIEAWTKKKPKKKPKRGGKFKGIFKIANTVLKLLNKIRRVLRPILKARRKFQEFLGLIAGIVLGIEFISNLFDMAKDKAKRASGAFQLLVEQFAAEASKRIQKALANIRRKFKLVTEKIGQADFVTREALAQAITNTMFKLLLKGPWGWVIKKLTPERVKQEAANRLIAPMIGDSLLDPINAPIRGLIASKLGPTIEKGRKQLNEVLDMVDGFLQEELVPQLPKLFLFRKGYQARSNEEISARLVSSLMAHSWSHSLPGSLREDMEMSIGYDFRKVQVHSDTPAQRAADYLGANAFTVGSHIYFGSNRYAPVSIHGRRLLAHELTHVAQQRSGAEADVLQRDAKSTAKKLAQQYAPVILKGITEATKPTEAAKKKVEQVKKVVDKFIGKSPRNLRGTVAEQAYTLVYGRGKKRRQIVRIRRKLSWIRLGIPHLTVHRGKLKKRGAEEAKPGSLDKPFKLVWRKPPSVRYPTIYLGGVIQKPRSQRVLKSIYAKGQNDETGNPVKAYKPHSGGVLPGGERIGLSKRYQIKRRTVVGPLAAAQTPGGETLNKILRKYGYIPTNEGVDADHVHEIQYGGKNVVENMWPLDSRLNQAGGNNLKNAIVEYPDTGRKVRVSKLKHNKRKYYFRITGFKY